MRRRSTRVIAGRKARIPYRGYGRAGTKKTWNAKWRERRSYAERVRPRTTKIIFSLTRLRCEAENSSRRKEIARARKDTKYSALSGVFVRLCEPIVRNRWNNCSAAHRKISRDINFRTFSESFGICESERLAIENKRRAKVMKRNWPRERNRRIGIYRVIKKYCMK